MRTTWGGEPRVAGLASTPWSPVTTTIDTYGHMAQSDFDPLLSMGVETLGRVAISG